LLASALDQLRHYPQHTCSPSSPPIDGAFDNS
jgi:hypothetical protein